MKKGKAEINLLVSSHNIDNLNLIIGFQNGFHRKTTKFI